MLILGERCLLYNSWGLVWGKILAVDWTLTLMRLMVYSFQIGVTTENEPCFQESMAALRAWWLNFFKHPIQITGENVKLELYGFIIWRYPPCMTNLTNLDCNKSEVDMYGSDSFEPEEKCIHKPVLMY